jgi:hypothetical protein
MASVASWLIQKARERGAKVNPLGAKQVKRSRVVSSLMLGTDYVGNLVLNLIEA